MVNLECEIPINFGNVVLQPESIRSYFKNPDSTWTYLVHWKDIWLHESLCTSFTSLVEEFWKNEETPLEEHPVEHQQVATNTDITNTCDIAPNIPGDTKIYEITDDNTYNISENDCSETNIVALASESMACDSELITDDCCEETSVNDGEQSGMKNKDLSEGKTKDNLKEIIIGLPFEQALSELDGETRNRLIHSLNDVPVTVDTDNDVISHTLSYHMTNQRIQVIDESPVCREGSVVLTDSSEKTVNTGLKSLSSNRNNPIECETCHKILSSRNSLREHRISIHLKNGRFPCDACGKRFTHQRALRLHRVMHTKDRKFVCPICSSSHKRERELKLHMRDMHTTTLSYRCNVCFQCFKMKGSLKQHCFSEHETTIISCTVCKQKLTTPFSIYTHCLKHAEPRDFKCVKCNREFKSQAQLKKHSAVHNPEKRPYKQCPKCLKLIFSRSHYYEHVNSHDNKTNEIVRFKCTQCDASFQHSSSLKRHRVRHRPGGDLEHPKQNPYIDMDENLLPDLCCRRCRKLYTSKSGYYEHKKRCRDGVSSEELCVICNKIYSSRKTLNRHVRHKHPTEEEERMKSLDKGSRHLECIENDPNPIRIVTVLHDDENQVGMTTEKDADELSLMEKSLYH